MHKRLSLSLSLFALLLVALLINPIPALATEGGDGGGGDIGGDYSISGGGCVLVPGGEEWQEGPLVCEGVVNVYANAGPTDEENVCNYVLQGSYDCDTGDFQAISFQLTEDNLEAATIQSACNGNGSLNYYRNCEINRWSGHLECSFWNETLRTAVNFPGIVLDIEPYPVTLVRWPTYFRFSGAGTANSAATLPFVGRGTVDHPMPGDQKNITLTFTLRPFPAMLYMQLHLPRAGYYQGEGKRCAEVENFMLPLQSDPSPPKTVGCWNVPSHPAAGAGPLAGGISGLDELASDMPLFVGWARVPYMAEWHMAYEQWEVVDRNCVLGPARYDANGNPVYECKAQGSAWNNGHWEDVYDWKLHTDGGAIDPEAVTGLPDYLKADINGDGRADAFWNYDTLIRRMNEAWSVNDPVYKRSWSWGGRVYIAVREGQTQSVYYPSSP